MLYFVVVNNQFLRRFEDIKGVVRSHELKKDRQYHGQKNRTKRQTMIYKILHRKLKIKQREHHKKIGVNAGARKDK
jgi:hypothetical protein